MAGDQTTVRGGDRPTRPTSDQPDAPNLRVSGGQHLGAVFELGEGEWVIGKSADVRICLQDSGVSRRHAKLIRTSDGLTVLVDLDSTNGTFVDDRRIETAPLREGARIGIGPDAELTFSRRPSVVTPKPAAQRKAPSQPNPLTKRELQIARLVARGLTNPQVAAELGIKAGTVSSHLDNIYARLRVSGRAALTRWLVESGLA